MRNVRTFAIGDIHGCYDELYALITKLIKDHDLRPKTDILVFLGDYIDRGPDSNKVIEQLVGFKKKYPHWVFLMGNHEHMFLEDWIKKSDTYVRDIWRYNGGYQTLDSYEDQIVPVEHYDFIEELQKYYEDDKYFYCHAGLLPNMTIEENKQTPLRTFLWTRGEFLDSDHDWGKKVITGHTPNQEQIGEPIIGAHRITIDGAICPSARKNLLCVKLPDEEIIYQPAMKLTK